MSDLISREEVLRTIITAGECEPDLGYAHLHDVIEIMPSADRQTGWIPVSERLPETGKDVLVTRAYDGRDDGIKSTVYVEVSACFANGYRWYGFSDEYKMNPQNHTVIAWMPLPEPYRKDGE